MRPSALLVGLAGSTLAAAAAQDSVGISLSVPTVLPTSTILIGSGITTTTVYPDSQTSDDSSSDATGTTTLIAASSTNSNGNATTTTTLPTGTSPSAPLPTASADRLALEGSTMGLVIFCVLGLFML